MADKQGTDVFFLQRMKALSLAGRGICFSQMDQGKEALRDFQLSLQALPGRHSVYPEGSIITFCFSGCQPKPPTEIQLLVWQAMLNSITTMPRKETLYCSVGEQEVIRKID